MKEPGQEELRHEAIREEQRKEALRREEAQQREEPRREEPKHEEPKHEEPRAVEPVPQRQEPKIDSKVLLESSGLVMVETDRSKATQIAPQPEEPQPLGRPRRERPKPPAQDEELQQVETKR